MFGNSASVGDPCHFGADPDLDLSLMDPDPTPDPTPFFRMQKNEFFPHIFFLELTHRRIIFSLKI